jgi:hypothetical protein
MPDGWQLQISNLHRYASVGNAADVGKTAAKSGLLCTLQACPATPRPSRSTAQLLGAVVSTPVSTPPSRATMATFCFPPDGARRLVKQTERIQQHRPVSSAMTSRGARISVVQTGIISTVTTWMTVILATQRTRCAKVCTLSDVFMYAVPAMLTHAMSSLAITCQTPPAPICASQYSAVCGHATLGTVTGGGGRFGSPGTAATYACHEGYIMVPETANTVECDCETGNYQPPSCQPKRCGSTADIAPLESTGCEDTSISGTQSGLYFMDGRAACTARCISGFSNNSQQYTCQADGTFSPNTKLVCQKETTGEYGPP